MLLADDAALARACIVASATYGLLPPAAAPAPCANGTGNGNAGNTVSTGNRGAASADGQSAELELRQSASSGALYKADRRRSSGYESYLAPETNELEIGIWMPSQQTLMQHEVSDNCNNHVNNNNAALQHLHCAMSPESNQQQYAPVSPMQLPLTPGHANHVLHSGQQVVQQSPLSPVNMNMHYAASHKQAVHHMHQQVQTSPPPALSKAQVQAQMPGRNASGNCSLLGPIEEASDAEPELPAAARAAAGSLRNCSGPATFVYPPARDPPAAAAVQSSFSAVELLDQLFVCLLITAPMSVDKLIANVYCTLQF